MEDKKNRTNITKIVGKKNKYRLKSQHFDNYNKFKWPKYINEIRDICIIK